MDRAKIVNYYLAKVHDPGFSILKVRQELEKNNFDQEEIKVIVRLVDNELQRRLTTKTASGKATEIMWVGAAVAALGFVLTLGTYFGILDMGDYFLVAYGPILGGLSILFYGMARR